MKQPKIGDVVWIRDGHDTGRESLPNGPIKVTVTGIIEKGINFEAIMFNDTYKWAYDNTEIIEAPQLPKRKKGKIIGERTYQC